MNVLAVIPARSGSKSVVNKNIRDFNGKPMLAHSIEHAKASKYINRIILSTDSQEYALIGQKYGAEIPFIRPEEYATDDALDIDVFYHCLKFLEEKEGYYADVVVQLRPTYPIRDVEDIDNMIEILLNNKEIDSVRSIASATEIPYKMWRRNEEGVIKPILTDIKEAYNMPRQKLPKIYYQNASIDVTRGDVILKEHSMSGTRIYGYELSQNFDIDTEEDFLKAERYAKILSGKNRYVFDIDGVIARIEENNDYSKSKPNTEMIAIINKLYEFGNEIILHTARGYVTGIDWREVTEEQLKNWGLKYHELHFGKPNADYYIDDKMLSMDEIISFFG